MFKGLRATRIVVALGLIALVAACSFTRFGYNQADTVASWMVDDYFGLDAQQKHDFSKRFDRFYSWHRSEQLPEYAAFMRTARGRVQQGLNREDVLWFVDGMRTRFRTTMRRPALRPPRCSLRLPRPRSRRSSASGKKTTRSTSGSTRSTERSRSARSARRAASSRRSRSGSHR